MVVEERHQDMRLKQGAGPQFLGSIPGRPTKTSQPPFIYHCNIANTTQPMHEMLYCMLSFLDVEWPRNDVEGLRLYRHLQAPHMSRGFA